MLNNNGNNARLRSRKHYWRGFFSIICLLAVIGVVEWRQIYSQYLFYCIRSRNCEPYQSQKAGVGYSIVFPKEQSSLALQNTATYIDALSRLDPVKLNFDGCDIRNSDLELLQRIHGKMLIDVHNTEINSDCVPILMGIDNLAGISSSDKQFSPETIYSLLNNKSVHD